MKAIEVQELTKRYGGLVAVDRISFSVAEGELFGFLDPDGTGKTTTVRMLTGSSGRMPARSGSVATMSCGSRFG